MVQSFNRNASLDIAKGIGILLVVLGHCPYVWNPVKQWLYSFHMPLFFMISGLLWDKASHEKRGFLNASFVVKKLQRLMIPCYIWALLYFAVNCIKARSFSFLKVAYLLYGSQAGFSKAGSLSSLWFFPCMFLTVCAFEGIQGLLIKRNVNQVVLLILAFFSAVASVFLPRLPQGYPWCLDVSFAALAFMILGYLIKDSFSSVLRKRGYAITVCLLGFLLLTLTFRFNLSKISINNADLAGRYFGNPLLYYFDAFCGSLFVLSLSDMLKNAGKAGSLLAAFGRHTIPILVIHKPVVRAAAAVAEKLELHPILGVACGMVFALLVSEILYRLLSKRLPILFGEGKLSLSRRR